MPTLEFRDDLSSTISFDAFSSHGQQCFTGIVRDASDRTPAERPQRAIAEYDLTPHEVRVLRLFADGHQLAELWRM